LRAHFPPSRLQSLFCSLSPPPRSARPCKPANEKGALAKSISRRASEMPPEPMRRDDVEGLGSKVVAASLCLPLDPYTDLKVRIRAVCRCGRSERPHGCTASPFASPRGAALQAPTEWVGDILFDHSNPCPSLGFSFSSRPCPWPACPSMARSPTSPTSAPLFS
jgi:hypothetical protein